jgi:GGDEF domain-containing protein
MNTTSAAGLPAGNPHASSGALTRPAAPRPELYAAGLYTVWAVIVALADAVAAAPLTAGGGLVIGLGCALTTTLFIGLTLLPEPEQPERITVVTAQSLMAMVWITIYGWFVGPSTTGSLLAVGMYLSAVAVALPSVSIPLLGRLMLAALVASAAGPLLQLAGVGASPGVVAGAGALIPCLVLAVLFTALYLPARFIAAVNARLEGRNAELAAGIERVRRHAERDHLTNSYSRQFILELVGREKARADRSGESLCICMLDIDHFKDMNDRYGHLTGDRILAAFSRRVRGALRTMDTLNGAGLPTDIGGEDGGSPASGRSALGRVGGEEFIVVLPETSLRGALKCAERLRKAVVRRPFEGLHQVTVSVGIAEYRVGETVTSLIGRADEALYGAKNAGRNRVHCATVDGPSAIIMPDLFAAKG